jgi:hypothetical protein
MTATEVQVPALSLDPATRISLLQSISDTLPHMPDAPQAERTALRDAAYTLVAELDPRGSVQAMLAAQIIATHHACMNAYRCAARPDLPYALHMRYQGQAASLSRLSSAKLRELMRLQAATALPVAVAAPGARAPQAPATAPSAPARQVAPASRPEIAAAGRLPGSAAPVGVASGTEANAGDATLDHFMAEIAARAAAEAVIQSQ